MWDFVSRSAEDGVVTGLPFTLAFLGVWLVFRLQRDFDLTVDGTFTLGGAISAAWIVQGGDPWTALVLASMIGGLGGLLTYTLMRRLRLTLVLTSIIVSLGLYSVAKLGRSTGSIKASMASSPTTSTVTIATASIALPASRAISAIAFLPSNSKSSSASRTSISIASRRSLHGTIRKNQRRCGARC